MTVSFESLGLRPELLKAVDDLGFESPMPIQEKAIPVLLEGEKDFIGLAQTGTGKTAAFGLPLLNRINPENANVQGLILCPTRELCLQITDDLKHLSEYMKSVQVTAVYGGASISMQIRQVKRGSQIIVATPGRLLDLIRRRAVSLAGVSYAILDEADEMLNMGFQEDINSILENAPENRKIWLFSATMPQGVAEIARNYLDDPVKVSIGRKNQSPGRISHTCYTVYERNRYQALKRIIDFQPEMYGLVFCRTRKETRNVAEQLMQDGYQAEALHGDLSQAQRDYVMQKFRQGAVKILVATDVAARGLDVDDISHVIHYNLPDESEVYTHRSGRTARAGKSGESVVLINPKEVRRVRALERHINVSFDFGKLPDAKAICKKQLFAMVEKLVQAETSQDDISEYLPEIYEALKDVDKEELVRRMIAGEFGRLFDYYRHAGDINARVSHASNAPNASHASSDSEKQKNRFRRVKTQRFFINIGRLDKINKGAIVRLICDKSGISSNMIGEISLNREFSFFEVEKQAAGRVRNAVNNTKIDGRVVHVKEVFDRKRRGKKAA